MKVVPGSSLHILFLLNTYRHMRRAAVSRIVVHNLLICVSSVSRRKNTVFVKIVMHMICLHEDNEMVPLIYICTTLWQWNLGNHDVRHNSPRGCRDALSKKCQRIHKTRQNKKQSYKKRTSDLWNTRREIQTQTKLDQPSWKKGQHQTPETRPQLQTSRKKRPWTPQETMAMRRCRNGLNDLIHGGRRWWWWLKYLYHFVIEADDDSVLRIRNMPSWCL